MALVWKRPLLTATEAAWRWLVGAPFLWLLWHQFSPQWSELQLMTAPLESMSLVHPVESLTTLRSVLAQLEPVLWPVLRWMAPLAMLCWVTVGTVGERFLYRRLNPHSHAAWGAVWIARLLRSLGVLGSWLLWAWMCSAAARWTIVAPAAQHQTPSVMPLVTIVIVGSLAIFTGWAGVSWPLALAQTLAVERGIGFFQAMGEALRMRDVRSQVLEINLVMCIVKLALLVLAMVFSACPLPFSSVETTGFLINWTIAVMLWYLVMSDLFHVVRTAAYMKLVEAV